MYTPFAPGPHPVHRQTHGTYDLWRPAADGSFPLVVFSHFSGGTRDASTFVCTHLASHGYRVAAVDHADNRLPRPSQGQTGEERHARMQALIDARVPGLCAVVAVLAEEHEPVGVAGHSFGGWTALAAPAAEARIASIVAWAPAGSQHPRPGIIPATLDFAWGRSIPTLLVAGDSDVSIPLEDVRDIFERAPEPKRLVALRRVDHMHFVDNAEAAHERVRTMPFPAELAWLQAEIRPFAELRPEKQAHDVLCGLTLAHFDATLKGRRDACDVLETFADTT